MTNTKSKTAAAQAETQGEKKAAPEKLVPKDVDINQYILVKNGFQGRLVYKSSRTGEKYVWDRFGDEQEMELRELRNAKNTSKRFFKDNWFMFDEDWVIDYLGVRQFYKYAIPLEEFDQVFRKSPAELKKTIANLSNGQRKSIAYRAQQLVASGEIDSRKTIAALEEALGVELIEK